MPAGDRKIARFQVGAPHPNWDVVKLGRKTYVRRGVKVLKMSSDFLSRHELDMSGYVEVKHASRG